MDRIDRLESQLAFQDDLLETLNRLVAEQQTSLLLLQRELLALRQRVQQIEGPMVAVSANEPPPPHY